MIYLFGATKFRDENVIFIPIIDIKPLVCENFSTKGFDAIIFTSKNAVKITNKLCKSWTKLPTFCIGEATSSEVLKLGGRVEFVCKNSYGDEFANEIVPLLKNKSILFPHAKEVVSDIYNILISKGLHVSEFIVYESTCKHPNIKDIEPNSIVIFTSPSSVKCFLKHFKFNNCKKVICIGKKTAKALPSDIAYQLPDQQNLHECVKLAYKY